MDGGTQPRAAIDADTVRDYADAMTEGAGFPPVVVFYDGADYWLADGFHRARAAMQIGLQEIDADVRQGTRRDAVLYSVGANAAHGMRRTNADKRRAVETLLRDEEWGGWSDREIARWCGVDNSFVSRLRGESSLLFVNSDNQRTYTTKHGTVATMNTTNIGKRKVIDTDTGEVIEVTPPTPTREGVEIPAPNPAPAIQQPPPAPVATKEDSQRADDRLAHWLIGIEAAVHRIQWADPALRLSAGIIDVFDRRRPNL